LRNLANGDDAQSVIEPLPFDNRDALAGGSALEDRPYLRPVEPASHDALTWLAALVVSLLCGMFVYYFWQQKQGPAVISPAQKTKAAAAAPVSRAEPTIHHPLQMRIPSPLPSLQESDSAI